MTGNRSTVARDAIQTLQRVLSGQSPAAEFYQLLNRGAVLEIVGTSPISGRYLGTDAIDAVFVSTLKRRLKSVEIQLRDVVANDTCAALRIVVRATTAGGGVYNADGALSSAVVHVSPTGLVEKIRFWPDSTQVESVIFDRRFQPAEA